MSNRLETGNVRILIPHDPEIARYNAAVIGRRNSDLLILVREVPIKSVIRGVPDFGELVVYRSAPGIVNRIGQLNLSDPGVNNWEDARAFCSDQGDEFLIGLTAIRTRDNHPVAATVRGRIIDDNLSIEQESLTVYLNDEGKNVTPISLKHSLFRRDGFRHSLEVVEYNEEEVNLKSLKVIKTIEFSKRPWCEWQIGTQAQLLPGGILPIHGVNRVSFGGVFHYTYSLGLALLDEDLNVVDISDTPLFTRESFKDILPMGKELDTNKDVVYCCGYSVDGDIIKFVINIGDLMTVEVTKSLLDLRKELRLGSPLAII